MALRDAFTLGGWMMERMRRSQAKMLW